MCGSAFPVYLSSLFFFFVLGLFLMALFTISFPLIIVHSTSSPDKWGFPGFP